MKKILDFLKDHWRWFALGVVTATLGYFIIFHGATSMLPGYSSSEIAAQGSSTSLRTIWQNPLNAPYKLLVWLPFKLGHHSVVFTRLAAGLIALASAGLFYFVAYRLFSHRIAIISTALFVTSSGFLHAAHTGTALILQIFGVLVLLALFPAYLSTKGKVLPLYVAAVVVAALLYIPGMLWFIIVGAIVLNKRLYQLVKQLHLKHRLAITAIMALLLTPLVWAFIEQPNTILVGLGVQDSWPVWADILDRTKNLVTSLFWSGRGPAEIMLVGAPILTIVEFGLLFIGIAVQFKPPRLKSNFFLAAATLFFMVLIILGGVINYITLTPLFYLMIAGGIYYLLSEWSKVFPVNPIARGVGNVIILLLIGSSMLFHLQSFYVAWPHSKATFAAFSAKQPAHYVITKPAANTPRPSVLPNLAF